MEQGLGKRLPPKSHQDEEGDGLTVLRAADWPTRAGLGVGSKEAPEGAAQSACTPPPRHLAPAVQAAASALLSEHAPAPIHHLSYEFLLCVVHALVMLGSGRRWFRSLGCATEPQEPRKEPNTGKNEGRKEKELTCQQTCSFSGAGE